VAHVEQELVLLLCLCVYCKASWLFWLCQCHRVLQGEEMLS